MVKITVFRFKVWDTSTGDYILAESFSTKERIEKVGGIPLRETAKEVDLSTVTPDGVHKPTKT